MFQPADANPDLIRRALRKLHFQTGANFSLPEGRVRCDSKPDCQAVGLPVQEIGMMGMVEMVVEMLLEKGRGGAKEDMRCNHHGNYLFSSEHQPQ